MEGGTTGGGGEGEAVLMLGLLDEYLRRCLSNGAWVRWISSMVAERSFAERGRVAGGSCSGVPA